MLSSNIIIEFALVGFSRISRLGIRVLDRFAHSPILGLTKLTERCGIPNVSIPGNASPLHLKHEYTQLWMSDHEISLSITHSVAMRPLDR